MLKLFYDWLDRVLTDFCYEISRRGENDRQKENFRI